MLCLCFSLTSLVQSRQLKSKDSSRHWVGWPPLAPGRLALVAVGGSSADMTSPVYRARRAAKEAKEAPAQPAPEKVKVEVKKFVKIGRPGYKGGCVGVCQPAPGSGLRHEWAQGPGTGYTPSPGHAAAAFLCLHTVLPHVLPEAPMWPVSTYPRW